VIVKTYSVTHLVKEAQGRYSPAAVVKVERQVVSGDPDQYYTSVSFLVKMACMIFAIVFHYTVQRKVVWRGASQRKTRAVAYVSLGSWAAVIFGAIFIAFGPSL